MYTQPYWMATPTAGRLAIMPRPRGGEWLHDEMAALQRQGVGTLVSALTPGEQWELGLSDEAGICATHSLSFIAFPVADRGVPADRGAFDALVLHLAKALRTGEAIVIHCRQGVGRSSLIAAGTLVALDATFNTAFDAIAAARGCAVPDTPEQRAWLRATSVSAV